MVTSNNWSWQMQVRGRGGSSPRVVAPPPHSPALGQVPRSPAAWLPQGRHQAAGLWTLGTGRHLPDTCWDTLLSRDWQWRLENTERKDKRETSEVTDQEVRLPGASCRVTAPPWGQEGTTRPRFWVNLLAAPHC